MRFTVAGRIQNLPEQFFVKIVKQTEAAMAQGRDVINLGRGNPDQPAPSNVVEAACRATRDPLTHGYSPFPGLRGLREAGARYYRTHFGVELDPDREVCILIGSKIGLVELPLCYLEPGDLCLMPDPGYPDYWSGVALAGGRMATMPLLKENRFFPDYRAIDPMTANQTKLMFLNYPCNPTAVAAGPEFFAETVAFAARHNIIVAHDLAYGELVYDGRQPVSFLQAPEAKEVGVEFYTFSKSYNMAGWRLGLAAGNAEVISSLTLIQDHLHCSQFPAIQRAGIEALDGPRDSLAALVDLYQERRNTLVEASRSIGWMIPPADGTFYCWAPVPKGFDSTSFSEFLLEKAGVMVAPGIGFGQAGDNYVRVSLCLTKERISEAIDRIRKLKVF